MNENRTPGGPGSTGGAARDAGGAPRLRDVSDLHEFDDVKRAYRALDDEPVPPALDANVLDAARAAVRPVRTRPRWLVPASLAATVLIAVGVSLDVRREGAHDATVASPDFAPASDAGPASVPLAGEAAAPAAAPAAPAAEPAPAEAAVNAAPLAEYAQSVPARREAFPASPPPPVAVAPPEFAPPPVSAAPIVADVAATPRAPPPEARADDAVREIAQARASGALAAKAVAADRYAAENTAAGASVREAPAAPVAASAAAPMAAPPAASAERRKAEAAKRTPEQWLRDIEALRRAGRTADADAEMARFRAEYPDWPKP